MFLLIGINPVSFFARSTPLDAVLETAPFVFAIGLAHGRSHHFEAWEGSFGGWVLVPMGWNRVMHLLVVVHVRPSVLGIIMNKHTSIPGTTKALGSTMKAFGGFVKELFSS